MKHSRRASGSSATSIASDSCTRCEGMCLTKMRLALLFLCSLFGSGASIQLLRLDVPKMADPRWEKVVLKCEYDLGGEDLYSVKWYKDGAEFFRFMPGSTPAGRNFSVDGVYVDLNRSDSKQVTLLGQANNRRGGKVNLMGSYGCEVSSEGPSFLTIYGEANMSVAIPPKERPNLRGLRPSYEAGETLQAECSSAASYPPARLVFILNGKEVKQVLTRELPSSSSTEDTMMSSSRLGLTMRLERQHFPGGTLTLGCQSTLPGIVGARSLERTETATLAASNQRLAQEPPRSGCVVNLPSTLLATVCCFLLRSFNYGILTFSYV